MRTKIFPSGTDFQVWTEEEDTDQESGTKTRLMFEFYEKPMASKLVIMENSALPHRMKITTLSQEIVRRMRNTCRAVSSKRRGEILSVYMKKLERSASHHWLSLAFARQRGEMPGKAPGEARRRPQINKNMIFDRP